MKKFFITGNNTDIGKTIITALLLNYFHNKKYKVITQKWVQTGNQSFSEDIKTHLEFINKTFSDFDEETQKNLCSYIFEIPASPHLSAKLENKKIDKDIIKNSFKFFENEKNMDVIFVEGAGGVLVPYKEINIDKNIFLIDIAKDLDLDIILVVENKLGAINQALLSIESIKSRNLNISGIIFNNTSKNNSDLDKIICKENIEFLKTFLNGDITILGELNFSSDRKKLIKNFQVIGDNLKIRFYKNYF